MMFSSVKKEWLLICVAWGLIFASTPLYMYYALVSIQAEFDWHEMLNLWSYLAAFLILFLLHHFLFVPRLIEKKRIWQYAVCVVAAMTLFTAFLLAFKPEFIPQGIDPAEAELRQHIENRHKGALIPPPDMARLVIALLMLGVDFGVVAWTNQQKMQQRLLMLEKQNLKQELEYLRYQINPHFFMNTLNNIHALVDIDQERAQRAIVELSGMMRYALYEGSGSQAPLQHEVEFISHYLSLMQMRYGNKVEVKYDVPTTVPADVLVPPLIFVSFIENAFKHGVSYKEPSFVHIMFEFSDATHRLQFRCTNSRHEQNVSTNDGHHGIGLENVKKRLELLYPAKDYVLEINDSDVKRFNVELVLPV